MTARTRNYLCGLLLAGSVMAVYWRVYQYAFVNFDDLGYIIQSPHVQLGLTSDTIRWALTSFYAGNWHPLTWLSHALDCQLFGLNSGGHHLTSVVLHAVNTVLLFWVLLELTGGSRVEGRGGKECQVSGVKGQGGTFWCCAFVAGLFGLHPMHVESVAWIAERKDVLSTFFFLLTIWAYAKYAQNQIKPRMDTDGHRSELPQKGAIRHERKALYLRSAIFYLLSLLLFALGLMSKPMLVTTPFVLLLLDYWPLRRVTGVEWRVSRMNSKTPKLQNSINPLIRLIVEKLPFLALSAADCVLTFQAQKQSDAVASPEIAPIEIRLSNSVISYASYLKKAIWPDGMAVYYPYREHPSPVVTFLAITILLVISFLVLRYFRTKPYLPIGWLWFIGTLVPVIGFVQVGLQSMADRYTYIPYIGLFVAAVWLCRDLVGKLPVVSNRIVLVSGSVGVLGVCALSSAHQVRFWQTSETLWRHTLEVTSGNPIARGNLGSALVEQARFADGAEQFREALRLKPFYPEAESNLGFALAMQGQLDEAMVHYRQALAWKPRLERTHFLVGNALLTQGNRIDAITEYRIALELNPDWPAALNDLGWILATDPSASVRNGTEAVALAERACSVTGFRNPQFIGTLAAAYAEAGRFPDAIAAAERAKDLATKQGDVAIAQRNEELLQYYRRGEPYHESAR